MAGCHWRFHRFRSIFWPRQPCVACCAPIVPFALERHGDERCRRAGRHPEESIKECIAVPQFRQEGHGESALAHCSSSPLVKPRTDGRIPGLCERAVRTFANIINLGVCCAADAATHGSTPQCKRRMGQRHHWGLSLQEDQPAWHGEKRLNRGYTPTPSDG